MGSCWLQASPVLGFRWLCALGAGACLLGFGITIIAWGRAGAGTFSRRRSFLSVLL